MREGWWRCGDAWRGSAFGVALWSLPVLVAPGSFVPYVLSGHPRWGNPSPDVSVEIFLVALGGASGFLVGLWGRGPGDAPPLSPERFVALAFVGLLLGAGGGALIEETGRAYLPLWMSLLPTTLGGLAGPPGVVRIARWLGAGEAPLRR